MGVSNEMSLAFQRLIGPAGEESFQADRFEAQDRLNVAVIFTSAAATAAAVRRARELAGELSLRITLIVPQVVPYPLPLESPPVLLDFSERELQKIAADSRVQTS